MKFNTNRFAKLAGINQSSSTLNESRYRAAYRRQALLREGLYDSDMNLGLYGDMMTGGSIDGDGLYDSYTDVGTLTDFESYDLDDTGDMLGGDIDGDDDDWMSEGVEGQEDEKDVVEIDDMDLEKEVKNIKKKKLNEARLKAVIEDELRDVLAEMQYGSSWMYGNNKPKNSKNGQVTRGFRGLGFK